MQSKRPIPVIIAKKVLSQKVLYKKYKIKNSEKNRFCKKNFFKMRRRMKSWMEV